VGSFNTEGDGSLGQLVSNSLRDVLPMKYSSLISCVVYRTNTFPLIHTGFIHAFVNIISLAPLMQRFEAEHGTLTSLLLFFGRESPGTSLS
jgi:membrane associated rhomboid family serine protease